MDKQVAYISRNIGANYKSSAHSLDEIQQNLKHLESQITRVGRAHDQGIKELGNKMSVCTTGLPLLAPEFATLLLGTVSQEPIDQPGVLISERKQSLVSRYAQQSSYKSTKPCPANATRIVQSSNSSPIQCSHTDCCSHVGLEKSWYFEIGTLGIFRMMFGSISISCSYFSALQEARHSEVGQRSRPLVTRMVLQYGFPIWAAEQMLHAVISIRSAFRISISLQAVRWVPYTPGNIFSLINSKNFDGAMDLLQRGEASVHDIEARHGLSVFGAALRKPVLSSSLIRFLDFLLQQGANPYHENHRGESAWHLLPDCCFRKA
jgi:hypothetical protein